MSDELTLDMFNKDNTTVRGKNLIKISLKNDKNEELSLKNIAEKLKDYIKEHQDKINDSIALIASYITGPFTDLQYAFIMGYLYSKYIHQLETSEKTKYKIEYTERALTEEEIKNIMADFMEQNADMAKDFAKKLRNGDLKPNDIEMV